MYEDEYVVLIAKIDILH